MDRFDAMRTFVRVVERKSFTLAAQDIGLPRSTVTQTIQQLEARLANDRTVVAELIDHQTVGG